MVSHRTKDININVAVSDQNIKNVDFYEYIGLELYNNGSLLSEQANFAKNHGSTLNSFKVNLLTLDEIFQFTEIDDIHWLKIDVEGGELNVLKGWTLNIYPWVVVIESIDPFSLLDNYLTWEYILLDKDYSYVYSDGINRYYLHHQHENLKQFFSNGPNIFDKFYISPTSPYHNPELLNRFFISSTLCNHDSELLNNEANENTQNAIMKYEIARLNNVINNIYTSRAWKVVKFLAFINKFFKL